MTHFLYSMYLTLDGDPIKMEKNLSHGHKRYMVTPHGIDNVLNIFQQLELCFLKVKEHNDIFDFTSIEGVFYLTSPLGETSSSNISIPHVQFSNENLDKLKENLFKEIEKHVFGLKKEEEKKRPINDIKGEKENV